MKWMKRASVALVLSTVAACVSWSPNHDRSADARQPHYDIDRVQQVNEEARRNNVEVHWVNLPPRPRKEKPEVAAAPETRDE